MKVAFFLSFISLNALALDCAGIPEGKVVRMDKGNGPLAKAAIQDQDGVGSCYANQGSLMLQSIIPGNPNLSYLNLGLYYATDYTIEKYRTMDRKTYNNYENTNALIEGGFACKAINSALARQKSSGHGVLCKSEDVLLEHSFFNAQGVNNKDNSSVALKVSAQYMTAYQNEFGWVNDNKISASALQNKRAKADEFKIALNKFVKNSGEAYFTQKCSQQNPEKMMRAMENALTRAINENPQCFSGKSIKNSSPLCTSFAQFGILTPVSSGTSKSSKVAFIQSQETREELKKTLPALFKNTGGMTSFLAGFKNYIKTANKSKISEKDKEAFAKVIVQNISPENMGELQSDYERIALKKYDKCKAENVLNFFQDKEFNKKISQDVVLCNYKTLIDSAQLLAQNLPKNAFDNMSAFVDFITDKAGLNYDEAMLSLIAKDCGPDKRVSIPENLKCDQVVMNFKSGDFKHGSTVPVTKDAVEVIKNNRARMLSNIENNRAFGVTICTKYWKDPNYGYHSYPTREKKTKTCINGRNSFHSITAIGYRCKNNKLQYLAQNSWGPNWKEENKNLEIENGKVWLDEDAMFQNLETIDYMSLQ